MQRCLAKHCSPDRSAWRRQLLWRCLAQHCLARCGSGVRALLAPQSGMRALLAPLSAACLGQHCLARRSAACHWQKKHLNLLRCDCAALLSARSSLAAQAGIRPLSACFELLKRHLRLAEWPVTTKSGRSQGLAADRLPDRNHTQMIGYDGAAQANAKGSCACRPGEAADLKCVPCSLP